MSTVVADNTWQLTDEQFCGFICMAAKRLGIAIHKEETDGKFLFAFIDMQFRAKIEGEKKDNKQAALKSACEVLVNYFNGGPKKNKE